MSLCFSCRQRPPPLPDQSGEPGSIKGLVPFSDRFDEGVGCGEAGAGLSLAALRCAFASSSLWKAPTGSPATAGTSLRFGLFYYRKKRLACFDFARRGPGGFDVVSRSRNMAFC